MRPGEIDRERWVESVVRVKYTSDVPMSHPVAHSKLDYTAARTAPDRLAELEALPLIVLAGLR